MRDTVRAVGSLALLVAALLACKASKPTAGGDCEPEGDNACENPTTHLACRGGKWQAFSCKGPKGCTVSNNVVECDATIATVDTACDDKGNGACSEDKKSYLECKDGKWKLSSGCLGPLACTVIDEGASYTVKCDESLAKAGTPCDMAGNIACSEDKKTQLKCTNNNWVKEVDCPNKGCSATRSGSDVTIDCE
ncbi:MAG: hypothetical protein JW751_31285 [Polyangiaceae bacterium]|nr:hypothetical protein [Polyangiaceae bacterium]